MIFSKLMHQSKRNRKISSATQFNKRILNLSLIKWISIKKSKTNLISAMRSYHNKLVNKYFRIIYLNRQGIVSLNRILSLIHTLILSREWNPLIINICKRILIFKVISVLPRILNLKIQIREILKVKTNSKVLILMIYFRFDFKLDVFIIIFILYYNLFFKI